MEEPKSFIDELDERVEKLEDEVKELRAGLERLAELTARMSGYLREYFRYLAEGG